MIDWWYLGFIAMIGNKGYPFFFLVRGSRENVYFQNRWKDRNESNYK